MNRIIIESAIVSFLKNIIIIESDRVSCLKNRIIIESASVVAISFIQTSSLSKRQLLSPNYNNKSNLFPCKRRSPRHNQYT